MKLLPISDIITADNLLPIVVLSLTQNGIDFHVLEHDNVDEFMQTIDIESLVESLPEMPSDNVFIFLLACTKTPELTNLQAILSIQIIGDSAIVEELELVIFSQEGSKPLTPETLVWGSESVEDAPKDFLDAFKAHPNELILLSEIAFNVENAIT